MNVLLFAICIGILLAYSFLLVSLVDDIQAYKYLVKKGYSVSFTKTQVIAAVFTACFFFIILFWIANGLMGILT